MWRQGSLLGAHIGNRPRCAHPPSSAKGQRRILQKRLWALEKRNNELAAEIANIRTRGNRNAGFTGRILARMASPSRHGPGRFDRTARMNNLATLLDNPEFSKLWNSQQKMALDPRYSALFKSLNLSPADLDKFKSLLVEKQAATTDVMRAARENRDWIPAIG